jgi:hypothetical protein
MCLKGIDVSSEEYGEKTSDDLSRRMSGIRLREDQRITTMVEILLKLRTQQEEGLIFACGGTSRKRIN